MRVVFDPNIFIYALVRPGSIAEDAILHVITGTDKLLVSKALLDQLLGVLARKFSRDKEALSRVALWISEMALFVEPGEGISMLGNEMDNSILECAVSGKAEAIVAEDKEIKAPGRIKDVPVIGLRDYLKRRRAFSGAAYR